MPRSVLLCHDKHLKGVITKLRHPICCSYVLGSFEKTLIYCLWRRGSQNNLGCFCFQRKVSCIFLPPFKHTCSCTPWYILIDGHVFLHSCLPCKLYIIRGIIITCIWSTKSENKSTWSLSARRRYWSGLCCRSWQLKPRDKVNESIFCHLDLLLQPPCIVLEQWIKECFQQCVSQCISITES